MNKKGFTLIELLAVIMIVAILLIVAVVAVNSTIQRSKDKSFTILVNSFEDGALQAYTECLVKGDSDRLRNFCTNHKLTGSETFTLNDLTQNGFIEDFKNPYDSNTPCDPINSKITVTLNSSPTTNYEKTKLYDYLLGVNPNYTYKVCLICSDKRSEGCN